MTCLCGIICSCWVWENSRSFTLLSCRIWVIQAYLTHGLLSKTPNASYWMVLPILHLLVTRWETPQLPLGSVMAGSWSRWFVSLFYPYPFPGTHPSRGISNRFLFFEISLPHFRCLDSFSLKKAWFNVPRTIALLFILKFICRSPKPQYIRMWLYLRQDPLRGSQVNWDHMSEP